MNVVSNKSEQQKQIATLNASMLAQKDAIKKLKEEQAQNPEFK